MKWLQPLFRLLLAFPLLSACASSGRSFADPNMPFGTIEKVAVLPFANLTREDAAAERVRDVVSTLLLASGAFYVLPRGEVARGLARAGVRDPMSPTPAEGVAVAKLIGVDALFTGVIREYGQFRSGTTSATGISMSLTLYEAQEGRVVWSGSSTQGGVEFMDRLLGGGGRPMNQVTQEAVDELLELLFAE